MNVYIFMANGTEEIEALAPYDLLLRAKINVKTVSINENRQIVGSHGISIATDLTFKEVNFENADMLVLPGGQPGTTNLYNFEPLMKQLEIADKKGIRIAAICAAPGILGRKGLLNNKKATSFPGYEEELMGANYVDEMTVTDKNITTSRGMGASLEFGLELVKLLCGEKQSVELATKIRYKD